NNVIVTNVPDYGVEEVSNHALSLLLSWARKIVFFNNNIKNGNWDSNIGPSIQRFSKQIIGVIGFGKIPQSFVKKAKAFHFEILVYDPYVSENVIINAGAKPSDLNEVFKKSDFISIHVPLTKETENLIDRS